LIDINVQQTGYINFGLYIGYYQVMSKLFILLLAVIFLEITSGYKCLFCEIQGPSNDCKSGSFSEKYEHPLHFCQLYIADSISMAIFPRKPGTRMSPFHILLELWVTGGIGSNWSYKDVQSSG